MSTLTIDPSRYLRSDSDEDTAGRCAAACILSGDIEGARWHALNFAYARDNVLTADESGIRWVLRGHALAKFSTRNAQEAGAWMLSRQ